MLPAIASIPSAVKWAGIVGAGLAFGVWWTWAWIDGMQDTITDQVATIDDQNQRLGQLREQRDQAVRLANRNAAELARQEQEAAARAARLTDERRTAETRNRRLQEALDEIDKWPDAADGGIGDGLRGALRRLRIDTGGASGAGAGDGDPADLRERP
jgi:hypothetical protein